MLRLKSALLALGLLVGPGLSYSMAQDANPTDPPAAAAAAEVGKSEEKPAADPMPAVAADAPKADAPAATTVAAAPVPGAIQFNGADTAWMLVSCGLVLLMTSPGLALFYGGLVRKKNILGVMMQCFFLMGLMSVLWAVVGYSFAFGGDNDYIGDPLQYFCLKGVIPYFDAATNTNVELPPGPAFAAPLTIPHVVFMAFQGMFFIITPGLICGAFAERMKFSSMCVFSALWGLAVYCPVAHWVWSPKGWLMNCGPDGAIDLAGGTVVHITSGVSALVCCLVMGKRIGFNQEPMPPHNLTYTCMGAGLLWFGWFGFNGGSAVAATALAANAVVATHMAAAAGTIGWSLAEWLHRGKPSILGACSGAVAGLVCITPASGSANPVSGLIMGFAASIVCFLACTKIKNKFGYDDSLDAFGVHGVGGILGALLTGVFATRAVMGKDHAVGIVDGNFAQMVPQIYSVVASAAIAIVGTVILLKVIDGVMGLRVSQDEERQGLDVTQHGEEGYIFL